MCVVCEGGRQCVDRLESLLCQAGTYSLEMQADCQPCAAGTHSDAGASSCLPCPPGHYCYDPALGALPCQPGYVSFGGEATCSLCPNGTSILWLCTNHYHGVTVRTCTNSYFKCCSVMKVLSDVYNIMYKHCWALVLEQPVMVSLSS